MILQDCEMEIGDMILFQHEYYQACLCDDLREKRVNYDRVNRALHGGVNLSLFIEITCFR